mmetsp:Transcript_20782/g.33908  ORF Transcript_20782/g.33908 Transcript_20782/m.33908 type:complete len:81 (-) Transcript_20782:449-691(-)
MHGRQSFEYACLVASGFMLCKLVDKVVKWGKARAPDASTHVEITHVKVKQGELDIGELVDMVRWISVRGLGWFGFTVGFV